MDLQRGEEQMVDATKQTMSRPGRSKSELRGGWLGGAADGFPRVSNVPEGKFEIENLNDLWFKTKL